MKKLRLSIATVSLVLPMGFCPLSASAATAHNSQAGGIGQSSNADASTVNSPRVKHAAKHKHM